MKSLIIAFSFFGAIANACPNLVGSFSVTVDANSSINLNINQMNLENGVVTYVLNYAGFPEKWTTDGQPRSAFQKNNNGSSEYNVSRYTCVAKKVVVKATNKQVDASGKITYEKNGTWTYSIDKNNNLVATNDALDSDGKRWRYSGTYTRLHK